VDILSVLNPQQKQAVTAQDGPVLVLAGPGSGKTRVLTYRIAYLVQHRGIAPYKILAVTFTNKAAREMESRVEKLLEQNLRGIWLGTFHGICARILRREAEGAQLPFSRSFVIFDDDDQRTLVKQALEDLNLDEKLYRPASVHSAISNAKNNLETPESLEKGLLDRKNREARSRIDLILPRVYRKYEAALRANNAVDFDDLLLWAWHLMDKNAEVRERYARTFEHILVDEFQDTNTVQYELLRLLASQHRNIFVVGDEDQSIYRWRGADYRNVLRFEEDFPRAEKILLEQNYRSTQTVLDAATCVINMNVHRTIKRLRALPDLGQGDKIVLHVAEDDVAEANYVVETIQKSLRGGANASDFAVMYRTNAQSRLVEEAFLNARIPYRLVGAQRFYGRREVKDMIAYLRLVQNPADSVSLERIINVPSRKIGDKAFHDLRRVGDTFETPMGHILMHLGPAGDRSEYWSHFSTPSVAAKFTEFGRLLAAWHEAYENMPLTELFDRILEETGYHEYIQDGTEEGRDRWENVQELRRLTFEFEDRGLTPFLESLALISDQDTVHEGADAATLLTLHAAKGLEFPVVMIVGLDEGVLPHNRALENIADIEELSEERRLFYVGLTRAMRKLYLVRAERRRAYGAPRGASSDRRGTYIDSVPSQFLKHIPDEYTSVTAPPRARYGRDNDWNRRRHDYDDDRPARSSTRGWSGDTYSLRTFTAPPSGGLPSGSHAPIAEPRFSPGMRVRHSVWEEGLVIESRLQDGDETVTVVFESVGLKRLVASLANLEILPGK
jgi:DNA helicase-2/ATP-dependent DNA helicase PcrA